MWTHVRQLLATLVLLVTVLPGARPALPASHGQPAAPAPSVTDEPLAAAATPAAEPATGGAAAASSGPAPVAPADLALQPCRLAAHRPACDGYAAELAAYGLDVDDPAQWTLFGLRRFTEAVELLADAFGGDGVRERRIAGLTTALGTGPGGTRVRVLWDATPQGRDGLVVRGGYAADRLYFNPHTLYLDVHTPAEAPARRAAAHWWNYVHELAHLWDERSAPAAEGRLSARLQRLVDERRAAGLDVEHPSSYGVFGGVLEAFAESVAATVTGDAANRAYAGSVRDRYVREALCAAGGCRP